MSAHKRAACTYVPMHVNVSDTLYTLQGFGSKLYFIHSFFDRDTLPPTRGHWQGQWGVCAWESLGGEATDASLDAGT